jgi:hypothetical protein
MPDSLDVAVQRKRIAELERHGLSTQEAEAQLRDMLQAVNWHVQADTPPQVKKRIHDQRSQDS